MQMLSFIKTYLIRNTFNSVIKYAMFFKNFNWVLNDGKGSLKMKKKITVLYAPQKHTAVHNLQGAYSDSKCVSYSYTH